MKWGLNNMKNIQVVSHPIIDQSLTILRDKNTGTEEFRRHAGIVSKLLLMEATKSFGTVPHRVETPLAPFAGKRITEETIVVPVLRAGLAMLFALQDFLPSVSVGFIGLERDEKTAIAREYYQKLPQIFSSHTVIVLDPMLATGGSFDDTVSALKIKGATHILCVCIVSAPEGIARIEQKHPDVTLYTAAIDESLNEKKYIIPGLGDFGDRYFGT